MQLLLLCKIAFVLRQIEICRKTNFFVKHFTCFTTTYNILRSRRIVYGYPQILSSDYTHVCLELHIFTKQDFSYFTHRTMYNILRPQNIVHGPAPRFARLFILRCSPNFAEFFVKHFPNFFCFVKHFLFHNLSQNNVKHFVKHFFELGPLR